MTITAYVYNNTAPNLVMGQWQRQDYFIGARLLTSQYTHNPAHATYADVSGFGVGAVVKVEGKTVSQSEGAATLDCSPLDFAVQGTFQAGWVALFEMDNETTPDPTSKLITAIKLNEVTDLDESVNELITISPTGLLKISPAGAPAVDPDVPVDPVDPDAPKACTIGKTIDDPDSWEAGDVICVNDFSLPGISLTGLSFPDDNRVTIRTTNNTKLEKTGLSGTSFAMEDCHGINIEGGFEGFGGLYAFRALNCDRIQLTDFYGRDVGQEIIQFYFDRGGSFNDIRIIRPKGRRSGLRTAQFGEFLYVGNGDVSLANLFTVSGVYIEDVDGAELNAEAIDIKTQVIDWEVKGGVIDGVKLKFNGAVTWGVEDILTANGYGKVSGLTTRNITLADDAFASIFGHYAIGQGNFDISDCTVESQDYIAEYAIDIYRTFANRSTKTVTIGKNFKLVGAISDKLIRLNQNESAYPGADNPGELVFDENNGPNLWFDSADDSTFTIAGDKVTEWRDKSGNGYNAQNSDLNSAPTYSADGLLFDGSASVMPMSNGPQLPVDCMLFAVVDADSVQAAQRIFAANDNLVENFGAGFSAGFAFFAHSDAGDKIQSPSSTGLVIISAYRSGNNLYINQDGQNSTQLTITEQFTRTDKWFLGGLSATDELFKGLIKEVRTYPHYSAEQFTSIKNDLEVKWGFDANNVGVDKPVDILSYSPVTWFDASDTSSIVATSNAVDQWSDKSGNAHHATASTTARPTSGVDTINALNAVSVVDPNIMTITSPPSVRFCMVAMATEGNAENEYMNFGGQSDGDPWIVSRWRSASDPQISLDGTGSKRGTFSLNGSAFTDYVTNFAVPAFTNDDVHVWAIEAENAFNFEIFLGRTLGFGNNGKGYMLETLWFDYVLSPADIDTIGGYLSDKWGGSL